MSKKIPFVTKEQLEKSFPNILLRSICMMRPASVAPRVW